MTEEKKGKITLVGLKQAKNGFSFMHEGPLKECEGCGVYSVCMTNLEPGRIYRVVDVRDKVFSCKIHEEGARVVEVTELDLEAAIESRLAFPDGVIPYQPQECKGISCVNYRICAPQGLKKGDKYKILEVKGQVKCPLARSLVLATLRRSTE